MALASGDLSNETISGSTRISMPSINPDDYDRVIIGETFNSTLKIGEGWDNTLIMNCTFTDIEGHGIELRDVSNVVIYNSEFSNISGTAIRLRSSGSTDNTAIISNDFNDIGLNAISAAKRTDIGVDHTNLLIHDNNIHDTGVAGDYRHHGIYVQTSDATISSNTITGLVGGNAISIRGDGLVWNNHIDVTSSDPWGSGIKYFSDNQTGPSKTLVIADNVIDGNSDLYSGIEIKANYGNIPAGTAESDWIVNDFHILRNAVSGVGKEYVIDSRIDGAPWGNVVIEEGGAVTTSASTDPVVDPGTGTHDLSIRAEDGPAGDPSAEPMREDPRKASSDDDRGDDGKNIFAKMFAMLRRLFGQSESESVDTATSLPDDSQGANSQVAGLSDLIPVVGIYDESMPAVSQDDDDDYHLAA